MWPLVYLVALFVIGGLGGKIRERHITLAERFYALRWNTASTDEVHLYSDCESVLLSK